MENQQERKKLSKGGIVAIIISIFIIIGLAGGLSSINNSSKDNPSDNPSYTYAQINQPFTYDDLEITITGFKINDYAVGGSYYAGENNIWLIIYAEIYNPTTNYKTLSHSYATNYSDELIYHAQNGEETQYRSSWSYSSSFINQYDDIPPYGTITGIYTYKVPLTFINSIIPSYSETKTYTEPFNSGLYFQFSLNKKDCTNKVRIAL